MFVRVCWVDLEFNFTLVRVARASALTSRNGINSKTSTRTKHSAPSAFSSATADSDADASATASAGAENPSSCFGFYLPYARFFVHSINVHSTLREIFKNSQSLRRFKMYLTNKF